MRVKRRVVRGLIGGALVGLGLGILLVVAGSAPFGRFTPYIPILPFLVLGGIFALVAPAPRDAVVRGDGDAGAVSVDAAPDAPPA